MAESQNAGAGSSEQDEAAAEKGTESDQNDSGAGAEGGDGSANADDKGDDDTGEGGDDDAEPPTRKRMGPKDFIIQRQQRKIEKMAANKEGQQADDGGEASGDDDDVDPADEATIEKVVDKRLAAEKAAAEAQRADDKEVNDFLAANPDFKPFEAKARKYMQHETRKSVPIDEIFFAVAGKALLKIGAKRGAAAKDEAQESRAGGGTGSGAGGSKQNAFDLPKQDFEAMQHQVRTRQR